MKNLRWKLGFLVTLGLLFSCAEVIPPGTPGSEDCTNGADDDADGSFDCQDLDCAGDPACEGAPDSEADCSNGSDDDSDFQIDCQDADCAGDPSCAEVCDNAQDDDFDTDFDCQDADCAGDPSCAEVCDNGQDDDFDGAIDCADSACVEAPDCNIPNTETNCANNQDDDADNDTDCQDADCDSDPNCNIPATESNCQDGFDDDADGDVDCQDADCAGSPACQAPACDPGNDQCTGDDICIVDECEPAFGRSYTFSGFEVTLDSTNESGDSWDPFSGAPDPKVEIFIDNQQILETANADDTFSATFNDTASAVINAGTVIRVSVLDVDPDADDFAVTCEGPLPASLLRARGLLCRTGDGITATLIFNINPN